MALGNLVIKLLLDSIEFQDNIKSAKAQIQGLEKVGKSITSVLTKFAGGIGIATSTVGTLTKIMRSSQATSDAFDRTVSAATITVDNFFSSIATGDFSAFNLGLKNMIGLAKEAYNAFDQLGNSVLAWNVSNTLNSYKLQDALTGAKDTSKSLSDRMGYLQTAKDLRDVIKGENTVFEQDAIDAIKKYVAAGINTSSDKISFEAIYQALTVDTKHERDAIKKQREEELNQWYEIENRLKEKYGYYQTVEGG